MDPRDCRQVFLRSRSSGPGGGGRYEVYTAKNIALAGTFAILAAQSSGAQPLPRFDDIALPMGISLVNVSGSENPDYILEANGNGAAFLDYDRDGDMDVLIINGSTLDTPGGSPVAALYRNDETTFTDVSEEMGIDGRGWAFGVCVADFDNDGDPDFYVTAWGPNFLYRNDGPDGFVNVAAESGVDDARWGTNCAFGDYDRDGFLDLYVSNYLNFDPGRTPRKGEAANCHFMGQLVFCGPIPLEGEADVLYRNNGDGTFTDRTLISGVADPGHYGFGAVFSDFDNDGWPDIYVANDSVPNSLLRNNGDGTFDEIGLVSGTALNFMGQPQAGMGVAIGDYDADGLFDIYVTNFSRDTNTLYRNTGSMLFVDETTRSRSSANSELHLGWGTGFVDIDNDGWLDIFVANGHTYPDIGDMDSLLSYREPKEVYRNLGDGTFEDVSGQLGEDIRVPRPARGAAFGDIDNDGAIDVLSINRNEPPNLYRNSGVSGHHWVGLRLEGTTVNRDAIGARVEIDAGGRTQYDEVRSGGSYLSHNDMRIVFGLGTTGHVDEVRVRWPNGETETFTGIEIDRYVTLRQGNGQPAERN